MLTTGSISSPRQGKEMSQAQHPFREPTVGSTGDTTKIKTTPPVQGQPGNKARDRTGNRHPPNITQAKTNQGSSKTDQTSSVFLHVIK